MKGTSLKRLLVIFPRGEAIAYFLCDDFLAYLSEYFHEIHFLTIENADLDSFTSKLNDICSLHSLKEYPSSSVLDYLISILDLAHNLKIKTVSSRDRIGFRRGQTVGVWNRIKLEINLFIARFFSITLGINGMEKLFEWVKVKFDIPKEIKAYLDKINPDIVFNTSHIHNKISLPYLYALKKKKIKIASFIFSWDNITSQGRIIPKYDYLLTWNVESKDLINRFYSNLYKDKIFVTGTPQFDHYFKNSTKPDLNKKEFCEIYSLDPNRSIIFYSTGMPHHMPGEPIIVKRIVEILEEEFEPTSRPQVLLRVYPKDKTGRFKPLNKLQNLRFQDPLWDPDLLLPSQEAKYLLKQTLRHIDLGINIASTLTLELLMFDKKILNIAYNPNYDMSDSVVRDIVEIEMKMYTPKQLKLVSFKDNSKWYEYDHYRDVTQSGCCVLCKEEENLKSDIIKAINFIPNVDSKRKLFDKKFSGTLDGNSIRRICKSLGEIASKMD